MLSRLRRGPLLEAPWLTGHLLASGMRGTALVGPAEWHCKRAVCSVFRIRQQAEGSSRRVGFKLRFLHKVQAEVGEPGMAAAPAWRTFGPLGWRSWTTQRCAFHHQLRPQGIRRCQLPPFL
jgi:hypothetical protein